jgi:hypothetical protein
MFELSKTSLRVRHNVVKLVIHAVGNMLEERSYVVVCTAKSPEWRFCFPLYVEIFLCIFMLIFHKSIQKTIS